MDEDDRRRQNLLHQAELYGAPLGDSVRTVTAALGISQAAVSRTIGISPPMLSQLMSGQRIKIANPQAVERLHSLLALAGEVGSGLAHEQIPNRLRQIEADDTSSLTRPREAGPDLPDAFSRLLRAVASGRELGAAADLLSPDFPAVAAVLRAYGTGRRTDADAHFATIADLL